MACLLDWRHLLQGRLPPVTSGLNEKGSHHECKGMARSCSPDALILGPSFHSPLLLSQRTCPCSSSPMARPMRPMRFTCCSISSKDWSCCLGRRGGKRAGGGVRTTLKCCSGREGGSAACSDCPPGAQQPQLGAAQARHPLASHRMAHLMRIVLIALAFHDLILLAFMRGLLT